MNTRYAAIIGLMVLILLGFGGWYLSRSGAPAPVAAGPETIGAGERHTMGDPNAPVTLIEYVSFVCPACAFVHTTSIPQLKRRYIDTGKVFYVLRIRPIDPADFKAEGLAMCVAEGKYFDAVNLLYRRQTEWGAEHMSEHGQGFTMHTQPRTDAGLIRMGRAMGLDAQKARSCMYDNALHKIVDDIAREGDIRYGLTGTPTIIINGKTFDGVPRSVDDLAAVIEKLLAP